MAHCRSSSTNSKPTHQVCQGAPQSDDDYDVVDYKIAHIGKSEKASLTESESKAFMVTVFVSDCPLQMEIDTGAEVSIIPEKIWNTAWKHVPVREFQARLSAYEVI